MSGIAGIYRLSSQPVDLMELTSMVQSMGHRGPDGTGIWSDRSVGLGNQIFHTTEESHHGEYPLVSRDGRRVLAADARIDNRAELIRRLGPQVGGSALPSDSQLILAAYEQWGRNCARHLVGAFAFVIWDASRQHLFCVRDPLGVKPFYYHHTPGRLFAFGSEIKALLEVGWVQDTINDVRVADYLASICANKSYTFYEHIVRLPPGHHLTVTADDFRMDAYWVLDLPEELHLASTGDYVEAFRERFMKAVECRLGRSSQTGALLSGGLDSASIVSAAQRMEEVRNGSELPTFSATFNTLPECDEQSYIRQVVRRGGVHPHFIEIGDYHPVREVQDMMRGMDEPMVGNLFNLTWRIGRSIGREDIRVVLDGHGGDEVISQGHGWPAELAREGRWIKLFQELRGIRHRLNRMQLLSYYWLSYGFLPAYLSRRIWRLLNRSGNSSNTTDDGYRWEGLLQDKFVRQTNLEDRIEAYRQQYRVSSTERERHFNTLNAPLQTRAFEELNHKSALCGIESWFPFWDRRLVSFCLSLPSIQKREGGTGRMILRRSMKDVLPDSIRRREDKTNFAPSLIRGMNSARSDLATRIEAIEEPLGEYIQPSKLHSLVETVRTGDTSPAEAGMIGKVLMLGVWLE